MNTILLISAILVVVHSVESNKGEGHDTLMRGGARARNYIFRRDMVYTRGACTNVIGNDACSAKFAQEGFTCNGSGYDFAKNCAKYCEFCV